MTISELLDLAETYYRVEGMACLANFIYQRGKLDRLVGHIEAQEFGALEVDRLKADLRDLGLAKGTVNYHLSYLRKGYKQAQRYGYLKAMPDIPYFRVGSENARRDFFEPDEAKYLLEEMCRWPDVRDVTACALYSGMRKGEILKLEWEDVRPGSIFLPAHKAKNRSGRRIPIGKNLQEVISRRRRLALPETTLVFHREGRRIASIRWPYKAACKRIGKPNMTFHACRRSFARWLIQAGIPEDHVMAILGWKSRDMLSRYLIVRDSDLDESLRRFDGLQQVV